MRSRTISAPVPRDRPHPRPFPRPLSPRPRFVPSPPHRRGRIDHPGQPRRVPQGEGFEVATPPPVATHWVCSRRERDFLVAICDVRLPTVTASNCATPATAQSATVRAHHHRLRDGRKRRRGVPGGGVGLSGQTGVVRRLRHKLERLFSTTSWCWRTRRCTANWRGRTASRSWWDRARR